MSKIAHALDDLVQVADVSSRLPIEGIFLAANVGEIEHGGWLPLVIAGAVYPLTTTWHRGSEIVNAGHDVATGQYFGLPLERTARETVIAFGVPR